MDFMTWQPSRSALALPDVLLHDPGKDSLEAQVADERCKGPRLSEAVAWLVCTLGDVPVDAAEVKAAARMEGISERTLQRARTDKRVLVVGFGYPRTTRTDPGNVLRPL